ncbi:MAG: 1-deoxy-D-xylulose-5-phosphate reductoisomerase [Synergistaceae bacterium]|jgi:1-deoxy-D-xylulose-5-phosphate reductoisomerase|nr:1-deoxy-D-xylulose-5-phosphate reductoisomerase [Synergistaceae bacterium]
MSSDSFTHIAVIGATGIVGGSVLDICARFPERFGVVAMAAHSNSNKLLSLSKRFGSKIAYLANPSSEDSKMFGENGIELLSGDEGLENIAGLGEADHVVLASSGAKAIFALKRALESNKDVSLANKESVVAAGPWLMPLVKRPDQLRPLDSEHNAIWQCMRGEPRANIRRVTLTASGGPFREFSAERMKNITPREALRHPIWNMSPKITVDSSNLMNKGIECIEATQLFGLSMEQVKTVIHPSSQVHGMVEFSDATVKLLLHKPDMRISSAVALAWPDRLPLANIEEFAAPECGDWSMEFSAPDETRFPCLSIAREAGRSGGPYPPLLIGADEVVVSAFLEGRIPFLSISNIIEAALEAYKGLHPSCLDDAVQLISEGERLAMELCSAFHGR